MWQIDSSFAVQEGKMGGLSDAFLFAVIVLIGKDRPLMRGRRRGERRSKRLIATRSVGSARDCDRSPAEEQAAIVSTRGQNVEMISSWSSGKSTLRS